MSADQKTATLSLPNDQSLELPIYDGTYGSPVIDIGSLNKSGVFTYDPGFRSTASCRSDITFIDGDKGILLHRGYPIEQLAESSEYLEVSYLLLNGELPNASQKQAFYDEVTHHTLVHEQLINFFNGFPRNAHPMAIMCGVVGALSAFYHDTLDIQNDEHRKNSALRLIAKMPTLAAMCYKYSVGHPFIYPRNEMSYAENFLNMMFSLPTFDYQPNPVLTRTMDQIFILHADHEQNASTSTVRLAGSSGANPFACIASGIAALWGPAHGGANEAVIHMLEAIGHPKNIPSFLKRAKDKDDPFRLMGFGHRVYKNFDPRAKIMRKSCHDVLQAVGTKDALFDIALQLEEIALKDNYFLERKLYPNVDFYSGIIMKAIGIPTNMFSVIFALSRTVGWVAHWNEMIATPGQSISRPRQLYTGAEVRDFVPLEQR